LHSTIFRPLDVIGLCVKESDLSDFATIVFEIRNKSTTDFEIIQNSRNGDNTEVTLATVTPNKPTVANVLLEKLENIPIAEQVKK
jgi:hypothetical protein